MTPADMAIEILRKTDDGDKLAPHHLSLLQSAVNGWLSEQGEVAFYELHAQVKQGYVKPCFHGIDNLAINHEGYILWRDVEVEHYEQPWAYSESGKQAAIELARRCRILESRGVKPTTTTAIWRWEG